MIQSAGFSAAVENERVLNEYTRRPARFVNYAHLPVQGCPSYFLSAESLSGGRNWVDGGLTLI